MGNARIENLVLVLVSLAARRSRSIFDHRNSRSSPRGQPVRIMNLVAAITTGHLSSITAFSNPCQCIPDQSWFATGYASRSNYQRRMVPSPLSSILGYCTYDGTEVIDLRYFIGLLSPGDDVIVDLLANKLGHLACHHLDKLRSKLEIACHEFISL
jgi:hypothetical protein